MQQASMEQIRVEIVEPSSVQGQPSEKDGQNGIAKEDAIPVKTADSIKMQSESTPLHPAGRRGSGAPIKLLVRTVRKFILVFFPSWTFLKFFAHGSIPALADNLVPLFFIGNIPDQSALAISAQFTFISVIVEVIQEGIGNSLFFYVGRSYTVNRRKSLQAFKICLIILFSLGCVLTFLMLTLTPQFVNLIDTPESLAGATRHFLYTSSFSFPFMLLNVALNNFLLITTNSNLITAQVSSVILSFLCNFFLFGQQGISLGWGIEQLGYYKIIQGGLSCANSFIFVLIIEKVGPIEFLFKIPLTEDLRSNFRDLFHVSWGNFGDSAVRNFFYFVVTLKFINKLGENEIAAWNLLNSIVWGLLLIPSFTVANYAKVRIGHHGTKSVIREVAGESLKCLIAWLIVVAAVSGTLWGEMAAFFGKSSVAAQDLSAHLLYEMGWIFIVFSFNNAMDSLFLGVGKTQYVFYQSLVTNLVVYLVPWVLYLVAVIQPTYWLVVGLYIGGMLVDFGLTGYFCFHVWADIPDY